MSRKRIKARATVGPLRLKDYEETFIWVERKWRHAQGVRDRRKGMVDYKKKQRECRELYDEYNRLADKVEQLRIAQTERTNNG